MPEGEDLASVILNHERLRFLSLDAAVAVSAVFFFIDPRVSRSFVPDPLYKGIVGKLARKWRIGGGMNSFQHNHSASLDSFFFLSCIDGRNRANVGCARP